MSLKLRCVRPVDTTAKRILLILKGLYEGQGFNALLQDARNKQVSYITLHRTEINFAEIFSLLLEIGDGEHQMFNSPAAKKQRLCSNMISWHRFPVAVRHYDDKTIQQFVRLKVLQS